MNKNQQTKASGIHGGQSYVRQVRTGVRPNRKSMRRLQYRIDWWEDVKEKNRPSLNMYKPGSMKKVA